MLHILHTLYACYCRFLMCIFNGDGTEVYRINVIAQ